MRNGFGLYQSGGDRGSVGRVSVFGLRCCGWCRWGVGDKGLYYVCLCCESAFFCIDGRSMYLYIMLGGYLRDLGTGCMFSHVAPYLYISAPTVYFLLIYHSAFRF